MIRKFKCADCGCKYQADESDIKCPDCGSENVSPYKGSSVALHSGMFAGCLLLGLALGFGAKNIFGGGPEGGTYVGQGTSPHSNTITGSGSIGNTVIEDTPLPGVSDADPVIQPITDLKESGGKYSFTAVALCPNGDPVSYELQDQDGKLIASSRDGKFTGIPASSDELGIYTLIVKNTKTGKKAEKPVPGFVRVAQQPVQKLTKEELMSILTSGRTPSDFKRRFSTGYKMNFDGLDAGEPAPDRIEEVINRLIGAWDSVQILDIKYNDLNKITSISFRVFQ